MHREEKRRKFHDAVIKMLYPPPPPSLQRDVEDKSVGSYSDGVDVDVGYGSGDLEGNSCSTSDENGQGEGKLSRAQRKRLRRKKLREDASRRGNIIGPLLPPPTDAGEDNNGVVGSDPQGVRWNAADTTSATSNNQGELPSGSTKKKLKHRRKAKRVAKGQLKSSSTQCCNQDPIPSPCDNIERSVP